MFITFEGIEGCGKTTQIQLLVHKLLDQHHKVCQVREPGSTGLGEIIRELFKHNIELKGVSGITELFLISASRSHLVEHVIKPALRKGEVVVSDRFYDTSIAYQGFGRGVPTADVLRVCDLAVNGTHPDLTFYLQIPLKVSRERKQQALLNPTWDRMDNQHDDFFKRAADGFDAMACTNGRFVTIDATQPVTKMQEQIWQAVTTKLANPVHSC